MATNFWAEFAKLTYPHFHSSHWRYETGTSGPHAKSAFLPNFVCPKMLLAITNTRRRLRLSSLSYVNSYDWEGNRRSGVVLAMRHRLIHVSGSRPKEVRKERIHYMYSVGHDTLHYQIP